MMNAAWDGLIHVWDGLPGVLFLAWVKTPTRIGTFSDWVEVSVGRFHTRARRSDQTIWCTGENLDGRLGLGNTARPYAFTQIQPFP